MKTKHSFFKILKELKKTATILFAFLFCMSYSLSVKSQVTINNSQAFTALDASDGTVDGVFTVNGGDLTITPTGVITGHVGGGSNMKINVVSGNLFMDIGAKITGDVNLTSQKGDSITIWASNITLKGNGTNGAKITSNQPLGASCNGGKGGRIYLNATGNISTENGSIISANASCTAGEIIILAPTGEVSIDGLVQSKSTLSGVANQPPSGGPITIIANCRLNLTDKGKVSSEGGDGGADLVHLEACRVIVWGLVQSTGFGHAVPTNPKTLLVPPNRPDKPSNSTAGVEIWGSSIVIDKTAPHNGEVNANLPLGAGARAWVDILASGDISIIGASSGNFAVHSNIGGNNGQGGIITVKSIEGAVTASGLAIQANGIGSGVRRGGPVTIESKNDLNLIGAKIEAKGVDVGGTIALRAFGTLPGSGNINANSTTNLNVATNGTVTETACGTIGSATIVGAGSITPVTGSCGLNPSLASQPYVILPDANCFRDRCTGRQDCPCIICDGEVVVDQNVTINFNNNPPTYSGDPDLLPYFDVDKTGGVTPDKWKVVFNLGAKKLTLTNNATITVSQVNGYAPGIEIITTCEVVIDNGSAIRVISNNNNAGNIVITASGLVTVNGEITNKVTGTNGLPGAITVTSKCSNIDVRGLIQILGVDGGGNTITLVTCVPDCVPPPFTGDITVTGLVKSYAHAHAGDQTINRPNIRVVSFNGKVVINANTAEPLYDEFSVNGGLYDIYGGLLSWVSDNVIPGTITVQALKDVVVNGHGTDPTGTVRKSFGAIAAIATASNAPGGVIDVRSLEGKIIGNDRAFDVSGRNRLAINYANIILNSKDNIELNRPGGNNNFNPVVNASGFGSGDKGGKNDLRSYSGAILIGANALVTAAVPSGTPGVNNLTSCNGITNNGTVTPAAVTATLCSPAAPDPLYTNCPNIDAPSNALSVAKMQKLGNPNTLLLPNYPNPFRQSTRINYILAKEELVTIKVFNSMGKEVATLLNQKQSPGEYHLQWYSKDQQAGMYYVRLIAGEYSAVNKLVVLK